jgi:DNA repair protein RecN (Recombination protein N)
LYEADGSIIERLRGISGILGESADLDEKLKTIHAAIKDATIALEEASFDLSRYLDRLDMDPSELAEVEDRLNVINRAVSKYGDSPESVLAYRQTIGKQIAELQRDASDLSSLEKQIAPLAKELQGLGQKLTAARKKAAGKLCPLIEAQLGELGMEKAKFTVSFGVPTEAESPLAGALADKTVALPSGLDAIEFVIQTNPGQLPQPLRKIASGGELSRVMLAIKSIVAASDRVSVLVFDEIDSNVGGRLGSTIGRKLRDLSRHHQVLCITHLPQIACFADRHLTVRKEVHGKSTSTSVRLMHGEERLHELAEMISGHQITPTTLAQVQELLAAAQPHAAPSQAAGGKAGKAKRKG